MNDETTDLVIGDHVELVPDQMERIREQAHPEAMPLLRTDRAYEVVGISRVWACLMLQQANEEAVIAYMMLNRSLQVTIVVPLEDGLKIQSFSPSVLRKIEVPG